MAGTRDERRAALIRRGLVTLTALLLVASAVSLIGFTAFGWQGGSDAQARAATARPKTSQPPAYVTYRDPQGRFRLAYPRGWQRLRSSDPQVALVLRAGSTSQDSVLVRMVRLTQPVDLTHLDRAGRLTDTMVSRSDVKVRLRQQIDLNGTPGFYYLYTFGKPGSDHFGIHAHYFLFTGPRTMQVLVCQALPDTDFVRLAPIFDEIAQSYHASRSGG